MKIEKKLKKEFFENVVSGAMNTDLRIADFECNEGDIIAFKEWDGESKTFTGREVEKTVVFSVKFDRPRTWTEEEIEKYGFVTISFK